MNNAAQTESPQDKTLQDELLTEAEVSVITKIPIDTLSTWRCRRKGPPFVQLAARTPRYSRRALEAWIAERSVKP